MRQMLLIMVASPLRSVFMTSCGYKPPPQKRNVELARLSTLSPEDCNTLITTHHWKLQLDLQIADSNGIWCEQLVTQSTHEQPI